MEDLPDTDVTTTFTFHYPLSLGRPTLPSTKHGNPTVYVGLNPNRDHSKTTHLLLGTRHVDVDMGVPPPTLD